MFILATKLHIPQPRPKRVFRRNLINRLNNGLQGKLTLISAPAGAGKTTLLSEWVASCEQSVAWLSLDSQDNNPARFLAYLIAAFQTISPTFGNKVFKSINSPEPMPTETAVTLLINEIGTFSGNVLFVLDDYHLIESTAIDHILTFLIEHLPPQLHIVIAARRHPNFPVARLRSQNQMSELLASDLRFTSPQITEFLNKVIGLSLTPQNIDILEQRTEGWIAGLQLAALALQGAQNTADFINSFTGSHHFVIDYLVEEVLHLQPVEVTDFLLKTSILTRFCGALCDALLFSPSGSSQEILDYLKRSNLLIVPLDNNQQWYRYHHLFGDALHARLAKEQPNQVARLHRQASFWYEQNDFRADGIHHALTAKDFERAADLIEQDWLENNGTYFRSETWLGWVKALPNEFVQNRPQLSLGFVWELLFSGDLKAAEKRVNQLDQMLAMVAEENGISSKVKIVDDADYRSLRASLAIAQAFHAQAHDDVDSTLKYTHQALNFVSETDQHTRGQAYSLRGLARLAKGDLDAAHQMLLEGQAYLHQAGELLFATSITFTLANIRISQGRLRDAITTYEQALQRVSEESDSELPGTADLYLGLSDLHHERGDKALAMQHLEKSEALGKTAALPEWPYPRHLAHARIKLSVGELESALALLNKAEELYQPSPVPNLRPVAALKARIWAVQGKLNAAISWAELHKLSIDDDLDYLREFEHITLTRLLIARYHNDGTTQHIDDALTLLQRLQMAATVSGRNGSIIEILILQALAYQAQGDIVSALRPLASALSLAKPEGYVRLFVDEGKAMKALLQTAVTQNIQPVYAKKLLALFSTEQHYLDSMKVPAPKQTNSLVEPLSKREQEILTLIAAGKKNQEIADQLIVSLNTIRYHTKNLYGKLGVHKRTQAVAKAQALGLIRL